MQTRLVFFCSRISIQCALPYVCFCFVLVCSSHDFLVTIQMTAIQIQTNCIFFFFLFFKGRSYLWFVYVMFVTVHFVVLNWRIWRYFGYANMTEDSSFVQLWLECYSTMTRSSVMDGMCILPATERISTNVVLDYVFQMNITLHLPASSPNKREKRRESLTVTN